MRANGGMFDLYLDQVGGLQYGALCGKDLPVKSPQPVVGSDDRKVYLISVTNKGAQTTSLSKVGWLSGV